MFIDFSEIETAHEQRLAGYIAQSRQASADEKALLENLEELRGAAQVCQQWATDCDVILASKDSEERKVRALQAPVDVEKLKKFFTDTWGLLHAQLEQGEAQIPLARANVLICQGAVTEEGILWSEIARANLQNFVNEKKEIVEKVCEVIKKREQLCFGEDHENEKGNANAAVEGGT